MASPPPSTNGIARPESMIVRPRSESRFSNPLSRPGTAASVRSPEEEPKTAVKVAVRVRPPLDSSDPGFDLIPARFRGSTCHTPNGNTLTVESGAQGKKLFIFDRVFSAKEHQEAVWEYVSESVDSFVEGYNVSLLAYGQSGAGKSYTMGTASPGSQVSPQTTGIVPRAATALFEKLGAPNSASGQVNGTGSGLRQPKRYSSAPMIDVKERNWQLKATYVEIYNEQLRDLLVPDTLAAHERPQIQIREDSKGRILVTGLQQVPINSVDDLMNALNFGSSIRQTDATAINSKSSRSHAVFSLSLVSKRNQAPSSETKRYSASMQSMSGSEHWVTTDSKLHFVDLAGSERLKNSGLTGERVKEGISINAGLASLGKVISQLSARSTGTGGGHVSYRDSRLTRLLQDSLGGNAITYMIACVNPVEFHLSETLNTVQYAQRARNIQTKPQIQSRAEDSDKQMIIDRLRSEVAFLREQIRHSDRSDRRPHADTNGSERRSIARENELQNQLLDIQESYSALSQRHARLISEIAHDKGNEEGGLPALEGSLAPSSLDRLKRSNNLQEAVEAVVMEYEKTIQSLGESLSSTKSSLSTSESSLLQREARLVYSEARTQQLQQRLQKSKDREATSDQYVRDLESKLEGVASGEEKQFMVVKDLRKELTRVRESESSAEEYISTLEERLAEAEQDTDIMQREIRRLEHVVERQRTVGKMDSLLQELDNMRQEDPHANTNGTEKHEESTTSDMFHDRLVATTGAHQANGEMTEAGAEQEWKNFGPMEGDDDSTSPIGTAGSQAAAQSKELTGTQPQADQERLRTQAQTKALADKLETVTIELFDLKVEHESTASELNDVSQKYQMALSTLAQLQDAMDDGRARTSSFLGVDGSREPKENGVSSASRTLQSDLSSPTESPTLVDPSEAGASEHGPSKQEPLMESVRRLKRENAEKDINMAELTENFSNLDDQYQTTLKHVEELKEEIAKAAKEQSSTPTSLHSPGPIRRSASQSFLNNKDREARYYANLRDIAVEHLQGNRDAAQMFERNIHDAAMESKLRNDRISSLELELAKVRDEINMKNTMISGLTRERAARSTPAMDLNLISSMRDHVTQSQKKIGELLATRESDEASMFESVKKLRESLSNHASGNDRISSVLVEGERGDDEDEFKDAVTEPEHVTALQREVLQWEEKHNTTMEAVRASEEQLVATITALETSLSSSEALHAEQAAAANPRSNIKNPEPGVDFEAEKTKHVQQVTALQKEIDGYKATSSAHTAKLAELESSYNNFMKEVEQETNSRKLTETELTTQRERCQTLEQQIEQQKSLADFHQSGLKSLEDSHAKELDELRQTLDAQRRQSDMRLTEQLSKHQESTSALQEELTKAHMELSQLMHSVAVALNDEKADTATLESRLRTLAAERDTVAKSRELSEALEKVQQELQAAKQITIDQDAKIKELTAINAETLKEVERSGEQERKLRHMVHEMEDQLASAYDDHQKRLSSVQQDADTHRSRMSALERELGEMKRSTMSSAQGSHRGSVQAQDLNRTESNASHLRKSNSNQSLPVLSPPPITPLPPIPGDSASPNIGARSPKASDSNFPSPLPPGPSEEQKALQTKVDEQDNRIKTIEKHLYAEKQLTQTLEEALMDLEAQNKKYTTDIDEWKKKCHDTDEEVSSLRKQRGEMRNSLQAVEEERDKRFKAEAATQQLQQRMEQVQRTKKKKGALNCF